MGMRRENRRYIVVILFGSRSIKMQFQLERHFNNAKRLYNML